MKHIIAIASLSALILYPALSSSDLISAPTPLQNPSNDDAIDAPARAPKVSAADFSRVNRKPAVEPRVYIESADSKTGFVYYDYTDQKPTTDPARVQHPPTN